MQQVKSRSISRSRSRSRSRDKDSRRQKLKVLLLQQSADQGNSSSWTLKDGQLLQTMIGEGMEDNQILREFRDRRVFNKRHDTDGKPELTYEQYLQKEEEFHSEQQLIRAFLRMEQGRQLPIDRYIKVVYMYKGKLKMQKSNNILRIMKSPKAYLQELSVEQLKGMIPEAEIHAKIDRRNRMQYVQYWNALIQLIQAEIESKRYQQQTMNPDLQQKVEKIMNKQLTDLLKLEKSIIASQKQNPSISQNNKFWDSILKKIKIRKLESTLLQFFNKFREAVKEQEQSGNQQEERIITSPILRPKDFVSTKLLTTEEVEILQRVKLAEKIFKDDFEKGRQKLQNNLSLPKNHNLLEETNIITDVNTTYDYIAQEILEFQRYKRLEQDQEDFNDWLPVETQGRFRDRKPIYVNRKRMAFQWNRYNQMHYDNENPPPKTVQGYKFNIFYPHLLDKTKTPQYYLQPTQINDYANIVFKAGPPYEDIAFKIVNKQWDFSEKSGFESIFAKGILHLYFNFKKPRYRI